MADDKTTKTPEQPVTDTGPGKEKPPEPEKALAEIHRVLKDDGVLIAPTFTHAGNSFSGKVRAFFLKLAGFPLHSRWTSEEYLCFLQQNGWTVRKSVVLKASFPLIYAECEKTEV